MFLTLFLCFFCTRAYAYEAFDTVLDGIIYEYGAFDGAKGVVYADEVNFSEYTSLLVVSVRDGAFVCEVYDDRDGMQCTDVFNIPYGASGSFTLSVVTSGGKSSIMLKINGDTGFYTVTDDAFVQTDKVNYDTKADIVNITNGKITAYKTRRELYNFLNGLKKKRIDGYKMPNMINTVSDGEKSGMMTVITACADVMEFDIRNYDYDTVMKYILCTNQNFKILTDIPSLYVPESGGLSIVSTEYIDYITENVFGLAVEHPSVNLLARRGFCADSGYYYYKNNFSYYATDILDAEGIYDLGDDMYYVVFSDIFRLESSAVPEYSYAVLKKNNGSYRLIKLGMGRDLLFERELYELSPQMKSTYSWENETPKLGMNRFLYIVLFMVCVSCGAAALVCGVIYIVRELR